MPGKPPAPGEVAEAQAPGQGPSPAGKDDRADYVITNNYGVDDETTTMIN